MDKEMIGVLADLATIIGFIGTVIAILIARKQLKKNDKSIETLAETINLQQQFLVNSKNSVSLRDLTINNFTNQPKKRYNKTHERRK